MTNKTCIASQLNKGINKPFHLTQILTTLSITTNQYFLTQKARFLKKYLGVKFMNTTIKYLSKIRIRLDVFFKLICLNLHTILNDDTLLFNEWATKSKTKGLERRNAD